MVAVLEATSCLSVAVTVTGGEAAKNLNKDKEWFSQNVMKENSNYHLSFK